MEWFEALILGLVQGLTEYLPVSSSGHLAIGAKLFGLSGEENLAFTVAVHVATVLSTCVILWKEIVWLFKDFFTQPWGKGICYAWRKMTKKEQYGEKYTFNTGSEYIFKIIVSMIPIAIVGFCFKDYVEDIFGSSLIVVGICLLVTAALLAFAQYAKPRQKENISCLDALIIGIAQALAVLPGLSRSGSTIATGILIGNKKESLAQFSFLMVIPPIVGEALLNVIDMFEIGVSQTMGGISALSLIIGFVTAFVVGCLACKWMINLVKKGKLVWFAVYCAIVGLVTIIFLA